MSRRRGAPVAPVAPRRVQGGLPGSPRSGLEQTKDGHPSSPAGTAAAECPEGVEPPAGEAPAAQISQRAPSPQGRGRLTARGRKALAFVMGYPRGGLRPNRHSTSPLTVSARPPMFCMPVDSDSDIMSHGALTVGPDSNRRIYSQVFLTWFRLMQTDPR